MEYERASKLARRGELVEAQAREVLKDIMKRADMGETLQTVSIKSHFDSGLKASVRASPKARGNATACTVEDFLKTLGKRANKHLTSLTAADVQRFLDHRTDKGLAPKTVNVDVKIIRAGTERGPAARFDSYQSRRSRGIARSASAWNAGLSPRRK